MASPRMIWLASIPRSGSTYLLRSICGYGQGGKTPAGSQKKHDIRKAHLQPSAEPILGGTLHGRIVDDYEPGDRALFVFGDVANAVVSTMRHRHSEGHWRNCGRAGYSPDDDLTQADLLDYEGLFDAWAMHPPFPVLCVKYECMRYPLIRSNIESWIGRDVQWLPWRQRRTKVEGGERKRIEEVYRPLVDKVDAVPGYFWAGVTENV